MNIATKIQTPSTDIAVIVSQTPVVVLTDKAHRESFYAHIEREVEAFVPDTSTKSGREKIASMAFKVTKTKTAIDAAGKQLNEDARAQINAVDAERRAAKEYLTALATRVRAPLTEWEAAEEARVAWCRGVIESFKAGAVVRIDDTAETVRARGSAAFGVIISPETFGDMYDEAVAAKDTIVVTLKAAFARLTQEESDRAELAALRAAAAEREARELAEAEAKALADREAQAAADREDAAKAAQEAAQRAEVERKAREERIAADAARKAAEDTQRAADAKAKAERDAAEKAHVEAIAAERKRAEDAERAAKAEHDRLAKIEADRKAEADREAAKQARRDADQAHRTKVKTAAKQVIMSCGADDETARKIVMAIIAGEVPNVILRF